MLKPVTKRHLRVYLATFGVALAATAIGVAINLQIRDLLAKNLLNEYSKQEELVADQVAQNLQNNIASVREKLLLAANLPEIKSAQNCGAKLQEAFTIMESKVGNLGRVAANGLFACSLNKALVGIKAATLGPYITQIFTDPAHSPVMSRAIKPPGADGYVAAVHVPVFTSKGVFDGTLGGAVYFSQIQDKFLKDITLAKSGFVILFDDNGDILYHPQTDLIGQNIESGKIAKEYFNDSLRVAIKTAGSSDSSGTLRYIGGGIEKLAAYHSFEVLPGHHWVAVVTVPVVEAESALTAVGLDQGFLAFTVVLTVAIFAIALAMLIGRLKSLELDQAKDEFLQLATHQLQTPVAVISWNTDLLLDGTLGKLAPEQKKVLYDLKDINNQQSVIIDDLLNVARLESGRLILKPSQVNIGELAHRVAEDVAAQIAARKQKLTVYSPEHVLVQADAERMRMVLDNLVSNASKYTHDGGIIDIRVRTMPGAVEIAVTDSGVGIAPKDMAKLFKKFSRIDNPLSQERGGTGLGLYLVKKIVALHKGTMRVESVINKSTTFTVVLPKQK